MRSVKKLLYVSCTMILSTALLFQSPVAYCSAEVNNTFISATNTEIPEDYTLLYNAENLDKNNSDKEDYYWDDEEEEKEELSQTVPVKEVPEGYTPIRSVDDLYGINNNLDGNYILMNDIDLSQTAPSGEWDFGNGWKPIDDFSGTLNGNGYRIMNMTIYGTCDNKYDFGLFAGLNGTIKNLGLVNINIDIANANDIGGIAANDGYYAKIENCFVTGTIISQNNTNTAKIGAIVGDGNSCYISNCYSNVNITAKGDTIVGGICGYGNSYKCYAAGSISGNDKYLHMIGEDYSSQCYYLKSNGTDSNASGLSEAQMQKEQCYTGFDFDKVWYMDASSGYNYPQLRNCPQARVSSCELTTPPTKLAYSMTDIMKGNLDLSGGILTVTYEDGVKVPVALENNMIYEIYGKSGDKQAPIKVFLKYVNAEISFDAAIEEIMATGLKLNKTTYQLDRGKSVQLLCSIEPFNAVNDNLTWTTSNELVATVSANGIVKGLNAGITEITASTDNGITASCTVTVNVPIKKLNFSVSGLTLKKGQKKKIAVTITPLDATDTIVWTSSNPKIAKVNSDGIITAKKQGTAVIMAKSSGGVSKKVKVTVKKK